MVLVKSLFHKVVNRTKSVDSPVVNGKAETEIDDGDESSTSASEAPGSETIAPKEGGKGQRTASVKAGGKRRKATRKR